MEELDPFFEIPWIHIMFSLVYNEPELWPKMKQSLNREHFPEPEVNVAWDIFDKLWKNRALGQREILNEFSKVEDQNRDFVILKANVVSGPSAANFDYYLKETRAYAFDRLEDKLKNEKKHAVVNDNEDLERQIALRIANLRSERDNDDRGTSTLPDLYSNLIDDLQNSSKKSFTPTGYRILDEAIGGWSPGNLIILAARPGMGKTACAGNFALKAIKQGKNVSFFSIEMSREEIGRRILASIAQVENRRLKLSDKDLTQDELDRLVQTYERITGDYKGSMLLSCGPKTLTEITAIVDKQRGEVPGGVDLVIVDYLGLIKPEGNAYNREREIAQLSTGLKHYAAQAKLPVICLAQPSREIERRDRNLPKNSDLRDSGQIEADADIIMWVHRDKDKEGKMASEVDLILTKNRHGEIGPFPGFLFDAPTQTLTEI
jgi:replicative DNA helicase